MIMTNKYPYFVRGSMILHCPPGEKSYSPIKLMYIWEFFIIVLGYLKWDKKKFFDAKKNHGQKSFDTVFLSEDTWDRLTSL